MDEFIVKQLKNLKKVRPNSSWLEGQRSFLLSEIGCAKEPGLVKETIVEKGKLFASFPIFSMLRFSRPAFGIALTLVVFVSSLGTIGAISAAQNSLPGDVLYGLKTAVESTQMSFASSDENKTRLSIKFANQRIDEVAQIADKPEKKNNIEQTVKNLTEQLVAVQENMDRLKDKNSQKAAEVAKLVNEQTDSYKETLIKTGEQLAYIMPEGKDMIKTEIDQALIQVNKTQEKAEEIIANDEAKSEETKPEDVIVPNTEDETESKSIEFEEIISE